MTMTRTLITCVLIWATAESAVAGPIGYSFRQADGKLYAINQGADVFVLTASPDYALLATNSLGEHTNATVVGSQGSLFVRTDSALWCLAND